MLQMAVRYYEKGNYITSKTKPGTRRKLKMKGYQVSKLNYQILKLVLGDTLADIPRSRIVHYRYITLTPTDQWRLQGRYVVMDVDEKLLPKIETITKTEQRPSVYLWREDQWWSFPQLETYQDGEMQSYTITTTEYGSILDLGKSIPTKRTETRQIEKTKLRVRASYEPSKGPGFSLTSNDAALSGETNPVGFPVVITGNGMVLEWRQGYTDKTACWWLRDEKDVPKAQSKTYQHYSTIKGVYSARWSRGFKAWYYLAGQHPPQAWLDLVGYSSDPDPETPQPEPDTTTQKPTTPPTEPAPLIPLDLISQHYGQYDWHYGNPDVWGKLVNTSQDWIVFIANANLTERTIYGYKLHTGEALKGEWVTLAIPDLDPTTTERQLSFTRQSLARAIRAVVATRQNDLPDDVLKQLNIPTDAACRRLTFQARQRELAAEREAQQAHAERMKPYHQFQARLQLRQRFAEQLNHLSQVKLLPAMTTPSLDDPWS